MKTTVDELQTLIYIVDRGSITLAAEELQQTASGVSRTLTRLEKKLGVTLLRRTTRKLDLTAEGENFLKQARDILKAFDIAEESVRTKSAPSGILRIDSATPFILHVVTPILEEFASLYPEVNLELFSSERYIDLLENRIDVAIRIGELKDSSLHAVSLGSSKRRIYASPQYLKKHGTPKSVEDLKEHHLIGFTDPKDLNYWPLRTGAGGLTFVHPRTAASSGETILRLAREGVGICCLSDFMTGPDRESGDLVQILQGATSDVREQIHAVFYKNTQLSQRAQVFIQFLKTKMKKMI